MLNGGIAKFLDQIAFMFPVGESAICFVVVVCRGIQSLVKSKCSTLAFSWGVNSEWQTNDTQQRQTFSSAKEQ
jgi:hypothetical protein